MKFRIALLAASCTLALAACGGDDRPADADPPSDATVMPADTTPGATEPVEATPGDTTPGGDAAEIPTMDETPADGATEGDASDAGGGDADLSATPNSEHTAAGAGEEPAAATSGGDCSTTIEGNDRIQFNVDSIHVPASCSEFTITLQHTGQLPVAAMGHNVVVTTAADYPGAAADGLTAGAAAGYVQPGDDRVIAATDMVGGGESTSVTFSTGSLDAGAEYTFFCSFPGHSALMRGTLTFGD